MVLPCSHAENTSSSNDGVPEVLGEQSDRVRVDFPEHGVKALKPANLKLIG